MNEIERKRFNRKKEKFFIINEVIFKYALLFLGIIGQSLTIYGSMELYYIFNASAQNEFISIGANVAMFVAGMIIIALLMVVITLLKRFKEMISFYLCTSVFLLIALETSNDLLFCFGVLAAFFVVCNVIEIIDKVKND